MRRIFISLALMTLCLPAWAQQDWITTFIGGGPNGIPAVQGDVNDPLAVAVDSAGNYYIAGCASNRVYEVNTSGTITVVAGLGPAGYAGDGVAGGAPNALLNCPNGVAVDSSGNVYISEYNNQTVRKVTTSGTISTIAGISGACGYNGDGSPATSFELCRPGGMVADKSGNLYIADASNCRVRKLALSTGTISTYAGTGSCGYSSDGITASTAKVNAPDGVALDNAGNLYIADTNNFRIRLVTLSTGIITTIAGNGTNGFIGDGGAAVSAEISYVYEGISVNSTGTLVTIADDGNQRIRQFTLSGNPNTGNINTIAGTGAVGYSGDGGAPGSAVFHSPQGLAVTASGTIYVADRYNDRVRAFTTGTGALINTVAGNGNGTFPTLESGVPPQGVVFDYPFGILEDPSGNVFVNDTENYLVRELVASTGLVNLFAGNGTRGSGGNGGPATAAQLNYNYGVARDSSGNIYIADTQNCLIREVTASNGVINVFAGKSGSCGYGGDGGPATSALLNQPWGIFMDSGNNLYIADAYNHIIRKVTGGTITTVAGTPGLSGYLGDGDPATAAKLNQPWGVTKDGAGNLYIADTYNCVIREVAAATGIITTVAGIGDTCGYTGDGPAIQNRLNYPNGLLADANGDLFVADTNNNRVRWIDPSGNMTTFAGNGTAGMNCDACYATLADLYYPSGIARDAAGDILIVDQYNYRVREVSAFAGLGVSSTSLNFGLVTIGGASTPQLLTINGLGPLTIGSIAVTGPFSESDNCGTGLANGGTCTVFVLFKPSAAGVATGTLTIYDNGFFNASTNISLSGTGSGLSVTGGPLVFGSVAVKTTSAAKTVTITNKSAASITMRSIALNETTDFAIAANTCPASGSTLAAAASCTVSVAFKPQTTGAKKGALLINDSDPSSPQVVGMTGTGTSKVAFSPSSITFNAQPIGTTSASSRIVLTNNTGATLTLGNPALSFSGPFASTHASTCTNGLPVAAGGTCAIFVTFTPSVVGYVTGTLNVTDSDASSPQAIALAGTGTGVEFTPSSVSFGTSNVGVRVQSTVTLTNVSGAPIKFTAWTITGTNAADFSTSLSDPPCGGTLVSGGVCTFTAYFTPSIAGAESATLNVYDNSPGSPQTLALSGTGQ
ncbi:MAG TPA: choice-of-anchor D domain-containing protein [Bryobacteraceae bacterium]|nr:choice-of-anchor D domain-containing protein [Bryobacteraceae bacterium]